MTAASIGRTLALLVLRDDRVVTVTVVPTELT